MSDQIIVHCDMCDCMHYHTRDAEPGAVYCDHPDKKYYMKADPCPLFRLDWKKTTGSDKRAAGQSKKNNNDLLRLMKRG